MAKKPPPKNNRKPPEPADSHVVIQDWMDGDVMPRLRPIVEQVDKLIRKAHSGPQYAVKWKKAYYGLPDRGWIIELVAYDVSVNVVFLGGGAFDSPPPLGEGTGRYVKVKTLDEAKSAELKGWIGEAARHDGWK